MRVIKFRGFNRKNNEWLQGYYLQNRGAHFVCPDEFAANKSWEDYEVDPDTVGQFTGLHDKDGKEIYEGDIVKSYHFPNIKHLIFYDEEQGRFMSALNGKIDEPFGVAGLEHRKWVANRIVIGNIHDDKDLIIKEG
jgi:uncharacterized phage protein (TIGR01671 family)